MKWTDINDLAVELAEAHPAVDPMKINFVDLMHWVLALPDFDDDARHCGEKILEAIQQAWIDERGMKPDDTGGSQRNVLGGLLGSCSEKPITGFFRDGCCNTSDEDFGSHTICVLLSSDFLEFSKARGNDLSTPRPEFGFPGLKAGDRWCLCAARWREALQAGKAPRVVLNATNEACLLIVSLDDLKRHAIDLN
jgi:FeS assembly protein IscX